MSTLAMDIFTVLTVMLALVHGVGRRGTNRRFRALGLSLGADSILDFLPQESRYRSRFECLFLVYCVRDCITIVPSTVNTADLFYGENDLVS